MSYKERLPEFNKRQEESSVKSLTDTIKRVSDSDHRDFLLKQEVWNSFVLPKKELINKSGIKELLEDIKKDIWTVGKIDGFGLSFGDLKIRKDNSRFHESDAVENDSIGYSLTISKPRFKPEQESDDRFGYEPACIYGETYGLSVSVEDYPWCPVYKKISQYPQFRIRYDSPEMNGTIVKDIPGNSIPLRVQDATIEVWEKSKQTLPFLINFANEPINKDVISAVKNGIKIPSQFKDILERYR